MRHESKKERIMRISVFGLGYVGTVSAGCLASEGHEVVGVDLDANKVDLINRGLPPIIEECIGEIVASNVAAGRLRATLDPVEAVEQSELSFVCVGTPSQPNGNLDLRFIRRIAEQIGPALKNKTGWHTVVIRSTIFPGTTRSIVMPILEEASGKKAGIDFGVCHNPEFLREGTAVKDFMEPSLLVLGSHDTPAAERIAALYAALPVSPAVVSLRTAELIKYACNAFHALKIAFANEIGTLAMGLGLAGEEVMETICRDTKLNISATYLKPGFAFGGSCLPKDLRALNYRARQLDVDLPLLNSVLPSNEAHISRAFHRVMETGCRKLGIYGLAFKPNTDDLRESPGIALIERLIGKGYEVKIYDPHIQLDAIYGSNQAFLLSALPHIGRCMEKSLEAVLDWADVLVVTQEPVPAAKANIERHSVPVLNVANANLAALAKVEAV